MGECPHRNRSYWRVCFTNEKKWPYARAYNTLYEQFSEEERQNIILPEDANISREDLAAFKKYRSMGLLVAFPAVDGHDGR